MNTLCPCPTPDSCGDTPATPGKASAGTSGYAANVAIMHMCGLIRRYGQRTVLNLSHLDIHAGEILSIVGPNGSGKSTLLRIMALLDAPDEGTLFFNGEPACMDNLAQRRHVSLLLQTPYLLSRSVAENVGYGLAVRGEKNPVHVREALEAVGLDPKTFWNRRRHELSGGEAQRVALAARLAVHPQVLLMDEPTASVDEESAARLAQAARMAAQQGAAVVIVSHDREWVDPLAHRLVRLRNGLIAR